MRLLHTRTYELFDDTHPDVRASPNYAILSHRWQEPEITFDHLDQAHAQLKDFSQVTPQLSKIRGACATARQQKLQWIWIDSICINKANAHELTTALNSMSKWYKQAAVCYAYLYDVLAASANVRPNSIFNKHDSDKDHPSEWFSRGWTLQELLAPEKLEFYDYQWTYMGKRSELVKPLSAVTKIDKTYLTGIKDFRSASIAAKMSWMANRTTGLVEDMAYSMLGLFNVNMSPQYGEGIKAFLRLQEELIRKNDESLFAWTTPENGLPTASSSNIAWEKDEWGLLAPSPDCFANSGEVVVLLKHVSPRVAPGFQMTQQGLSAPVPSGDRISTGLYMIPVTAAIEWTRAKHSRSINFTLNCFVLEGSEKDIQAGKGKPKAVQLHLKRADKKSNSDSADWKRVRCNELSLKGNANVPKSMSQMAQLGKFMSPVVVPQPEIAD